jgi:hypothetical protein
MRLTDHLAASRCLYHRATLTMPDVMMIDIPPVHAGASLPLGRYYPIILETAAELDEIEAFLSRPRLLLVLPDLLDRRPSNLESDCIVIARYRPPVRGWPWLLLCRWPSDYTVMVPSDEELFARGAYTSEAFVTRDDLIAAENLLKATLARNGIRHIHTTQPDIGYA